jgi:hypothetical protein
MAKPEFFRRNLSGRVKEKLDKYDAFVGEVAWLSDYDVLAAMAGKCLGLVTQKRPIGHKLRDRYTSILCPLLPDTVIGVGQRPLGLGQVRGHGTFHSWSGGFQRGPRPFFMHRKILVLGDFEAHSPFFMGGEGDVHWVFRPKAVWSGSYNMTKASRRHCEQVVYIEDEEIAAEQAAEFWETYQEAG